MKDNQFMDDVKDIRIADFDYPLPEDRIAKFPLAERDRSKLLVYRRGELSSSVFADICSFLPSGKLMVMNNTRVIQARIHFRKATGALIEVFLLEPALPADYERMFQARGECEWLCLVGNLKKWKGERLQRRIAFNDRQFALSADYEGVCGTSHKIRFSWDAEMTWADVLDLAGELPIPPYLNRAAQEADKTTYQTVYAKIKGSVAAPTAGLHFTPKVLDELDRHGIDREEITLHVGAGTFKPVKSATISGHAMHAEYFAVRRGTVEKLLRHGGRAIAVGTTTVRTLESLYYLGARLADDPGLPEEKLFTGQWEPYDTPHDISTKDALQAVLSYMEHNGLEVLHAATQIIIVPGYDYRVCEALITNFHQPKSTLLLLVSAFIGGDWRRVYDYALAGGFRFLSYGDACLLIP